MGMRPCLPIDKLEGNKIIKTDDIKIIIKNNQVFSVALW